jgi:serine/threonine protein kinase
VHGIAAGLEAAHENGVVHRDVKPSNIFLTPTDEPKVGDFGIARLEVGETTATLTGAVFVSPAYVSPEQVSGGKVGPGADLYSLGCVLYRMLAGRPPFEGDPAALTYQHVHEQPAPFESLGVAVPAELSNLVFALLEKDPNARPRTAEEVRLALSSFVAQPTRPMIPPPPVGPTVELPPVVPAERRSGAWRVAALAVVALLLIALMGWALARWGGNDRAAGRTATPRSSPAHTSPAVRTSATTGATSPPSSTPPQTNSPSATSPSSSQGAVETLSALVTVLQLSGAIDPSTANAIEHTIRDIRTKADEPDEVQRALDDLRDTIEKNVNKGALAPSTARRLLQAIDAFAATVPSGGEGD